MNTSEKNPHAAHLAQVNAAMDRFEDERWRLLNLMTEWCREYTAAHFIDMMAQRDPHPHKERKLANGETRYEFKPAVYEFGIAPAKSFRSRVAAAYEDARRAQRSIMRLLDVKDDFAPILLPQIYEDVERVDVSLFESHSSIKRSKAWVADRIINQRQSSKDERELWEQQLDSITSDVVRVRKPVLHLRATLHIADGEKEQVYFRQAGIICIRHSDDAPLVVQPPSQRVRSPRSDRVELEPALVIGSMKIYDNALWEEAKNRRG